jgi:hypothetical protein
VVDIQTLSIVVASASVVAGVIYYSLQIRHQNLQAAQQTKMRQTDLLMRMYLAMGSEDMNKARLRFLALKITDYDDFVRRYGPPFSAEPSQVWEDLDKIGWFYNGLGLLVHKELADIELVNDFLGYGVVIAWEKMKPLAYGWRREYNMPKSFGWFEYLYNEIKKREQAGVRNG